MKKIIVKCKNTSENEVINIARNYFRNHNYEYQNAMTDNGDICIQAKKSNWIRSLTGTNYAIQLVVHRRDDETIEITAGWGSWFGKSSVILFATFIAFWWLAIPASVGFANQAQLPSTTLDAISATLTSCHSDCYIYQEAKA